VPCFPTPARFPQGRQLISLTRAWECQKTGRLKAESRIFITSLESEEKTPAQLAGIVRGHWAIENKNHWKRDTTRWREGTPKQRAFLTNRGLEPESWHL